MANGSFGLSGLPSAPTTVGSAPNNPFTPVSVAVNSTAGFEAGDLVYNFGGDIAIVPANYAGTSTFPITDNAPTYAQNISSGEMMLAPVTGGSAFRGSEKAAKLTNGNIVFVYTRTHPTDNNNPYFKITDENGTVVVAETRISGTLTGQNGMISVCALTGGGFAVAWYLQSGAGLGYAIYSNAGAVVTAATTDAGAIPTASCIITAVSRPDGSWIAALANASNQLYYKVFSATGTQVYAWTNAVTMQNQSYYYKIVVRSDNSFVIIYMITSNLSYIVRSATNTVLKTATAISTSSLGTPDNWGGATLLAGDTTLVTWTNGTTMYRGAIDSANNTSLAQTAYSFNTTYNWQWAVPFALTDGNYMLMYMTVDYTVNTRFSYLLGYAVLNSSHVVVQTSSSGSYVYSFTTSNAHMPTPFQTANYINVFGAPTAQGAASVYNGWNNGAPINMQWVRISPTTYETIKANSTTVSVGNSSAQAVSGYARSGSTPTSASFFSSATTTLSTTSTAGTVLVPQTTIDTGTVVSIDTATLTNGTCLVLYRIGSGGSLKLAVLSAAGVLLSTTTIVTTTSSAYANITYSQLHRIAVLTDGKIAISYLDTSNVPTLAILSSTYSVLTTLGLTNVNYGASTDGYGLAALTNARFVFVYRRTDNGQVAYRVYNSSLTLQSGEISVSSATSTAMPSCAGTQGGFVVNYTDTGAGSYYTYSFIETSTNNWTASNNATNGVGGYYIRNHKMVTGPNGTIYDVGAYDSAGNYLYLYISPGMKSNSGLPSYPVTDMSPSGAINFTAQSTLAVTAYSEPIAISTYNSTSIATRYNNAGGGISTGSGVATFITGLSVATGANGLVSAVALTGRTVLVAFLNAANQLTYLTYNAGSVTYTTPLVAGVTVSNPVSITKDKGFSLVGVSSTASPANGSGTVVINGPAQLNSNYPSTTTGQSFDFGNPVTFGAAGTISGRNVNLIGNV